MTRPRLLILHPALAPYRVDMFNALGRRCDLELLFLSEQVGNQAFDQARLRALLTAPHGYLLDGLDLAGRTIRLGIRARIRRFRPDVVITTEFGQATLAVVAARRSGLRFGHLVGTEDNPCTVAGETFLHRLGRRLLLPLVDAVLTYSEEARALYLDRFQASRPVVASPLVQDEQAVAARLRAAEGAAASLAEAHGLDGRRVLLYVGRLAPEKRVDRLVDAVGRLAGGMNDLVLALVGDGPERERLERQAAAVAPGRVIFAGRQEGEALAAWYRLGTAFALPSAHEPFGAVVNEALVAGLPVVCSDRAGARVLVSEGRNGAVVDAGQPGALDAALVAWLGVGSPRSAAPPVALRPSLMTSTFEQAVDAYLAAVEAAARHRTGSGADAMAA